MSDFESNTTTDHDTIKNWTEERGRQPARVPDTVDGLLQLDFGDENRFFKFVSRECP